jgi:CheY-like chemotaxis protein
MFRMPLFNFPGTIVWIDDSSIFLEGIKLSTNEFDFNRIKIFENPVECLRYLQDYTSKKADSKFLSACKKYEESDLIDHLPVDMDFEEISRVLSGAQIEDEISVLIVDYDMPEMNGIELCRQLKHLPCKKIILTGAIGEKEVIAAFNDGIIDCFIHKNGEGFISEINTYVKLLSEKYLAERSAPILSHLETSNKLHFSDPAFAAFYSEWLKKNDIVKYFIVDKFGSMRVVRRDGKAGNFVIYSDSTLSEFIDLNSFDDEDNEFLQIITSKKKIPFFGEGVNGWDIETDKWGDYLFPCDVIQGREAYYWCVVNS